MRVSVLVSKAGLTHGLTLWMHGPISSGVSEGDGQEGGRSTGHMPGTVPQLTHELELDSQWPGEVGAASFTERKSSFGA